MKRSVLSLAGAGVAVGVMSEILVGSISEASEAIGLSEFFVGLIVVAIVGNAAEHWVAIYFATRDKMDLSVNIAIGSSAQIALFAAPVLVLLSFVVGPFPMALVFNGLELGAILLAVLIAQQVTQEGESTWFEGLQLLAVYVVLGLVFFFV
jgi:Ca2+:H+ antiporter